LTRNPVFVNISGPRLEFTLAKAGAGVTGSLIFYGFVFSDTFKKRKAMIRKDHGFPRFGLRRPAQRPTPEEHEKERFRFRFRLRFRFHRKSGRAVAFVYSIS